MLINVPGTRRIVSPFHFTTEKVIKYNDENESLSSNTNDDKYNEELKHLTTFLKRVVYLSYREREEDTEIFHPLFHCPNDNNWGWARIIPGPRSSHVCVRDQNTQASSAAFPRPLTGSWIRRDRARS